MTDAPERGLSRRDFVKAAVAIGGSAALAACADREGFEPDPKTPTYPTGTDPETLPERQHAWADYLVRDRFGNTVNPQHQLLLFLDYVGETPPTDDERTMVSDALQTVERAVQWGTGTATDTVENEGVLFTLGYSPAYFERTGGRPESVALPSATEVIDELDEDAAADGVDAVLVLASDYGSILLAIEQALFGEAEHLNGEAMPATLSGVFERRDRRTGFVGHGLPAERLDHEDIPEESPLSMGFKSGFHDNIPPEDKMTLQDGPFAEGTTQLVSRLALDLDSWYDRDHDERVSLMFSPHHSPEEVGDAGVGLAQDSGITEEMTEDLESKAREHGCLGHTQKTAAARDDDFEPRILRRSEAVATDADGVEFNFTAVQRTIEDFVRTREAMNRPDTEDVPEECHGILPFMEVKTRGTYLIPPRSRRALPVAGQAEGDG
jgi:hypothetical protein